MDDDVFVKTLKEAIEGKPEAIQTIIDEYGNLINKYSCRNGEIDEDCKQYIKEEIIKSLKKFKNLSDSWLQKSLYK